MVRNHFLANFMIYLFDAVTGTVISSILHRRVSRPFHVVHCENWLVVSLFEFEPLTLPLPGHYCFSTVSLTKSFDARKWL